MNDSFYLTVCAIATALIAVATCFPDAPWSGPLGIGAICTLVAASIAGSRD